MVYGVTGEIGGGKSRTCVRNMVNHIRGGGFVITNIDLHQDKICENFKLDPEKVAKRIDHVELGDDFNPFDWKHGDFRGQGNRRVMIVIDEAAEWLSPDHNPKTAKLLSDFLRQTDKRGQDVYLIVQEASLLAKKGRVIAQRWIRVRNMAEWRIPKLGWKIPPPWNKEFHVFLLNKDGKELLSQTTYIRDQRYADCYTTDQLFGETALKAISGNAYDDLDDDDDMRAEVVPGKESIKDWIAPNVISLAASWIAFQMLFRFLR